MRTLLQIAGGLLAVVVFLALVLSAGMLFEMIGDTGPVWTMGLLTLLIPCLIWLYRQFRKIPW
jgi:hypothetical protein